METRSKKNHNICLLPVIFNFMVRDLFKGKWCHSLPNIKCLSNGSPCIKLSDLGGIVVYTVWMREKGCLKVQIPFKTYYNSNTQPPLQSFHFWNVFIVLQTLLCACKVLLLQIKPPPTTALMQSTFINKNNPNTLVYLISFSESLATFQILTYKVSLKNVNYSRFCVKISH